jgi:hypothetical protein
VVDSVVVSGGGSWSGIVGSRKAVCSSETTTVPVVALFAVDATSRAASRRRGRREEGAGRGETRRKERGQERGQEEDDEEVGEGGTRRREEGEGREERRRKEEGTFHPACGLIPPGAFVGRCVGGGVVCVPRWLGGDGG